MKLLLVILTLTSFLAQGQTEKKIAKETIATRTYLKIGDSHQEIFCGLTEVEFFFDKKRVIVESLQGSIDLRIIERNSERWIGVDDYNNYYIVRGFTVDETFGIVIIPKDQTKQQLGYIVCKNHKICED